MYSFEKLCLPCYSELIAYAAKRTKSKIKAEDIVQEAVARALVYWDRWEPKGEPAVYARAWMFRIVSNVFSLQYQREKTLARLTGGLITDDVQRDSGGYSYASAEVGMVTAELHQNPVTEHPYHQVDTLGDEVRDAMERIRPEWADVVRLVYIEGIPAHEVAVILAIAPGTVRSRMARGRLALARILSPFARQRFGFKVKPENADEHVKETVISDEYESPDNRGAFEPDCLRSADEAFASF